MACELSARVTPGDAKCLQYRLSGSDTCRWCVEFAPVEPVIEVIKPVEVVDMAARLKTVSGVKKGDKFLCPECNKVRSYESNGKCGSCNHRARLALKQKSGVVTAPTKKLTPKKLVATDHEPDYFGSGDLPTGPVVKASAKYADLNTDAESVSTLFGKVENIVGELVSFGVDPLVHMAMRDAWYEVERKALESLSGLSPVSALARAHNFVQQIQRLEV